VNAFDPSCYGPAVYELLAQPRAMPLGPGQPDAAVPSRLSALTAESLLAPRAVEDATMAAACMAGLWLYFDHLEDSHRISQAISTPTGGYWHGIMHRREPDYSNAKYWFRRIGNHPILGELAAEVSEMEGAGELPTMGVTWDPILFVDLCQAATTTRPALAPLCLRIQQREWELLFDYCYRQAVGDNQAASLSRRLG
jgi:hypothetical protein